MVKQCVTSFDCNKNGTIKQCYTEVYFSEEKNFCDCFNFYGWSGDNCDIPGVLTYYSNFSVIFLFILYIAITFTSYKLLYIFVKCTFFGKKRRKSKINPVFWVLLALTIASTLLLVQGAIRIKPTFSSDKFDLINEEEEENVIREFEIGANIVFVFAANIVLICSLIIILSWFDLLINVTKIFPQEAFWSEYKIRQVVFLIVLISFVIIIPLSILSESRIIFGTVIILSLSNIVIYTLGYICFNRKLKQITENLSVSYQPKRGLFLIKRVFFVNLYSFITIILTLLLFAVFGSEILKATKPGNMHPLKIIIDIAVISFVVIISVLLWYSKEIMGKLFSKEIKIMILPIPVSFYNYRTKTSSNTT